MLAIRLKQKPLAYLFPRVACCVPRRPRLATRPRSTINKSVHGTRSRREKTLVAYLGGRAAAHKRESSAWLR